MQGEQEQSLLSPSRGHPPSPPAVHRWGLPFARKVFGSDVLFLVQRTSRRTDFLSVSKAIYNFSRGSQGPWLLQSGVSWPRVPRARRPSAGLPASEAGGGTAAAGRAGGWRSPRPELRDRRRGHLPFPSLARGAHPSLFVPSSGPVRSPPLPVTPIQEIVLPFQRHPPPCPLHCPLSTSCF